MRLSSYVDLRKPLEHVCANTDISDPWWCFQGRGWSWLVSLEDHHWWRYMRPAKMQLAQFSCKGKTHSGKIFWWEISFFPLDVHAAFPDSIFALFSPHMTSVVGTIHVGQYIRSRHLLSNCLFDIVQKKRSFYWVVGMRARDSATSKFFSVLI